MDAAQDRFRSCYESVYDDVLRFVQRRTDPSAAEDIVADAFAVAWRRVDELPRALSAQRAWVFTIARNLLLNVSRGESRRRALAVRVAGEHRSHMAAHDEAVVDLVDLGQAFRALKPGEQETLALAEWDGLSGPEAARVLGITATAFRLRLSRARRALRDAYHEGRPADVIIETTDEEGAVR